MATNNITINNAKLLFRNFAGIGGQNNPEGDRNFCVLLTETQFKDLQSMGMNVKTREPKDPQDGLLYFLPVKVEFGMYPPKIFMVTKEKKTKLDDDTIKLLDVAEIEYVDLEVNPYHWTYGKKSGIKAYAKTMYVVIAQDPFEEKYKNVPESAVACMPGEDC